VRGPITAQEFGKGEHVQTKVLMVRYIGSKPILYFTHTHTHTPGCSFHYEPPMDCHGWCGHNKPGKTMQAQNKKKKTTRKQNICAA